MVCVALTQAHADAAVSTHDNVHRTVGTVPIAAPAAMGSWPNCLDTGCAKLASS